jgi:SnoaL-like domain
MKRKLIISSIALAFFAAPTLSAVAQETLQWDDKASKDLVMALHHMHDVANSGDMKALKQILIGDDELVTFELASDNMTPVALRSKKEIHAHLDRISESGSTQLGNFTLDMPKTSCRATATFGVCTEECTIHIKMPNGTERVDHLFGTGTAIKTDGAWKWVQWHMSIGAPSEKFATTKK